jgi:tetratricopeptide (TPR) repeat protein
VGLRDVLGSEDMSSMSASYNYAACLQAVERHEEAAEELKTLQQTQMRVLGPFHWDTSWTTWRLVAALRRLGRDSEIAELLKEVVKRVDDGQNTDFYMLASAFAAAGDDKLAFEWLQKTADLNPDDIRAAATAVRARLTVGDVEGYRDACARMAQHFAASHDDKTQFWLTWTCGMGQQSLEDIHEMIKRARELVARDPKAPDHLAALGMLLYRAASYEEAAERLEEARAAYDSSLKCVGSTAHASFCLAMAEWQLGRKDEARDSLQLAQKLYVDLGRAMSDWNRRATLDLFRGEAEALISAASASNE